MMTGFFATASAFGVHEKSIEDVVEETIARRSDENRQVGAGELPDSGTIRVLLLGLDARKEDQEPHCDAIHLFAIDTTRWTVAITSVPRGTYAYIPKEKLDWEKLDKEAALKKLDEPPIKPPEDGVGPVPVSEPAKLPAPLTPAQRDELVERAFISQESYLANACAFMGLDYGVKKIEGVLGTNVDYRVTVGFSQTMGVLRLLGLPATEGLQWLRHRQSYAIGEPQRSRNQATFMKDLVVAHIDRFKDPVAVPLARVFYSFVDTDVDFDTAYALLRALIASDISTHPERITLSMKPPYPTVERHFDPQHPLSDLEGFYASLAKRLPEKDYSGATTDDVRSELLAYLYGRLASAQPVDDLVEKEIWLQVEDEVQREHMHFALVERAAHALSDGGDAEGALDLATAFVIEKETLGLDASERQGRELLAGLIRERDRAAQETGE